MKRSFIEVHKDSHFPIQNLPFGVFRTTRKPPRIGVAIGDFIFDMAEAESAGLFRGVYDLKAGVFDSMYLNSFMKSGKKIWSEVRRTLMDLLDAENPILRDNEKLRSSVLVNKAYATMLIPVKIGDYTDFYASLEHATNVGTMFRGKENALQPNWRHLPVGYHGRASSIFVSGGDVKRPVGQILQSGSEVPVFSPTKKMDFELETAFFIGSGNSIGEPISIENAESHIFGMVLMNDWSARDIQKWEYVPLGPFSAKNFYTSISPWVVMLDALEPFRTDSPEQIPIPLPYLHHRKDSAFDINLEVSLRGKTCDDYTTICRTNFKHLYWSMSQQLTHHTVTGCNMRTGDLLGSGTISGSTPASSGCLLEMTKDGEVPFKLTGGATRTYLENGDTVRISGFAQGEGYRVGFGEIINTIVE